MNRTQSEDHRIGTYEINISSSCFNEKIYIQNKVYDALPLHYFRINYKKELSI